MCLGQKPFNSPPFPAIWRDLRQMLSLAVAVWGSQENKLRSLFSKDASVFPLFCALKVWLFDIIMVCPRATRRADQQRLLPNICGSTLACPPACSAPDGKKLNGRPNIPPTLPVGCGLTSKNKIQSKETPFKSEQSWNNILKKDNMVCIKECTWKLDYDQFWLRRDWKMYKMSRWASSTCYIYQAGNFIHISLC